MRSFLRRATIGILLSLPFFVSQAASAETLEIAAGSDNTSLLKALATAYQKDHPDVTINVPPGPRSYDDLAQDLLRRATVGDQLPELLVVGNNQRLFAERGLAQPLSAIIEKRPDSLLATATPVVREKGRIGNDIYGIAFGISLPVALFNADLVRQAGGDTAHLPTDWTGILDLADKINKLGGPVTGGFIETDGSASLGLLYLIQSQGGTMMSADETKLTVDSPQGVAAMKILAHFGRAGQAKAAMTRDQARQAFGAGTIGVFVTMSSTIPMLEKAAGDRFKVVSVALPVVEGKGTIPSAGPIASIMSKDPQKQEAALAFIEFLVGPEGQRVVAEASGYYPLNEPAIEKSEALKASLASRPNAHAILERLSVATSWYTPPGNNAPKIATITSDNLLRAVSLKATPEETVKAITEQVAPLLPSLQN